MRWEWLMLAVLLGCGGGSEPVLAPAGEAWNPVTQAIQTASPQFPGGLAVQVLSPQGLVYSHSEGGFSSTALTPVASASKWVSGTVLLRLVDQGVLSLDSRTSDLLVDRGGQPWGGNLGQATLRQLLSFTTGINGTVLLSEVSTLSLEEAVLRIYDGQAATASVPGSYFYYGSTHLRIAARMAEVATGKPWAQIYDEQLRQPLGWGATSVYTGTNPNPAGTLLCTGEEYLRFLAMELHDGLDGGTRILPQSLLTQARSDQCGAATVLSYSPYHAVAGKGYHYGLCNWLETAGGAAPSAQDPILRVSSTGKFGWAPWIAMDGSYAALIETQQADTSEAFVPSENLKLQLDPLIRAALAQQTPVLRAVP